MPKWGALEQAGDVYNSLERVPATFLLPPIIDISRTLNAIQTSGQETYYVRGNNLKVQSGSLKVVHSYTKCTQNELFSS